MVMHKIVIMFVLGQCLATMIATELPVSMLATCLHGQGPVTWRMFLADMEGKILIELVHYGSNDHVYKFPIVCIHTLIFYIILPVFLISSGNKILKDLVNV